MSKMKPIDPSKVVSSGVDTGMAFGGAGKLSTLTDVNAATAATGNVLSYDGAKWVSSNTIQKQIDALRSGIEHEASVLDISNAPPTTPSDGDIYIVGTAPTGAFAGKANQIAYYENSAWTFTAPRTNEAHLNEKDDYIWHWNGTKWVKITGGGTDYNEAKLAVPVTGKGPDDNLLNLPIHMELGKKYSFNAYYQNLSNTENGYVAIYSGKDTNVKISASMLVSRACGARDYGNGTLKGGNYNIQPGGAGFYTFWHSSWGVMRGTHVFVELTFDLRVPGYCYWRMEAHGRSLDGDQVEGWLAATFVPGADGAGFYLSNVTGTTVEWHAYRNN